MKGGLKPTIEGIEINKGDPQVNIVALLKFYRENQGVFSDESGHEIPVYPPLNFPLVHCIRRKTCSVVIL